MTYNFRDDPAPVMPAVFDPTGGLTLEEGSTQGNLLTEAFSGSSVTVSVSPPSGWSLDSLVWSKGESGTFDIPGLGEESTYLFTYTVSQNGTSMSDTGSFKIKNQGNGGNSGGG